MRILSIIVIFFISTNTFSKDIEDIEIGDLLTEEQLLQLKPYHRTLGHYSSTLANTLQIYTDVYSWHGDHKGLNGKKSIQVVNGTNQVVAKELLIKEIIDDSYANCFFFTAFANDYLNQKEKYNILDLVKNKHIEYNYGEGWYFNLDTNKDLGRNFFSTKSIESSKIYKTVTCGKGVTILQELLAYSKDEKNNFKEYINYLDNFTNTEPFGFPLYSSLKNEDIVKEIDVGIAQVKPRNPSQYFNNYTIGFVPDKNRQITSVSASFIGDDFEEIYLEVKKLLKKKYEKVTYVEIGEDLDTFIYVSYASFKNSKWDIFLTVYEEKKKVSIEYSVNDWDINYDRKNKIEQIKSDSL